METYDVGSVLANAEKRGFGDKLGRLFLKKNPQSRTQNAVSQLGQREEYPKSQPKRHFFGGAKNESKFVSGLRGF